MKSRTVLLDIDGTLRDTSGIAHLVTETPKRYDEFSIRAGQCPSIPRIISVVRERFYRPGWTIVIATGQKEKYRDLNELWVKENLGPTHWMSMRQNDDHRPAAETKLDMLRRLRVYGYNVVEAWDDDPDVVAMYHRESLDVHWVFNQTRVS